MAYCDSGTVIGHMVNVVCSMSQQVTLQMSMGEQNIQEGHVGVVRALVRHHFSMGTLFLDARVFASAARVAQSRGNDYIVHYLEVCELDV